MKRVLVTGARGFIGRHALRTLLAGGVFDVHAVTSRPPPGASLSCAWHVADLLDCTQVKALFATVRPTHLLHFAWHTVPGAYWTASENFAWVQASLELLRCFQECDGTRVVMAGTCAEYDWSYGYCSEFLTPKAPTTPYGACKLTLQTMLDAYAQATGLSSAWGRIFSLYGPHEHPKRLVASVINALLRGELAYCSHGNQVRDFLHVQDVADAFVTLLDSALAGPVNIASGRPITLKEIVYIIAEKLHGHNLVQLNAIPTSTHDPPMLVADVRRLHNEVGWSPNYDLHRGLEQTIHWWKNHIFEEEP